MYIERLRVDRWRNLDAVELTAEAGATVVLEGRNGQGKTSILEALYLCATGRSFRHCLLAETIRHGAADARVNATLVREDVRHDVQVQVARGGRRVLVDGRSRQGARALLDLLNMVAFVPDDLRIIKEGPERRRQFLDRAVANAHPPFVVAALAYHRALRARNALLRRMRAPERAELAAYDRQLGEHGAIMHSLRLRFIDAWRQPAAARLAAIAGAGRGGCGQLDLGLAGGVAAWDEPNTGATAGPADLAAMLVAALSASHARDRGRGMTQIGPHRADLHCLLDGRPARAFASQGQQRAVVLALKLAEVASLAKRLGTPPILLLDDVASELDSERTHSLFEVVAATPGQVFVTTCNAAALPLQGGFLRLRVLAGRLERGKGGP